MSMAATVHLAFAFEVGYEIDLERARVLVTGEEGHLVRRRRTPESLRYRPAPVRVGIDPEDLALPGEEGVETDGPALAELSLFDFGAVSLRVSFPIRTTPEALLRLAGALADTAVLTDAARRLLAPILDRIGPTVTDFVLGDEAEEYVVFQLPPVSDGWVEAHAAWVAGLVRLEAGPLSTGEVREATRLALSYAPNDAVVLDWAAGAVADRDAADTLQIIEFANVQLLEYRFIDDRLDDRLEGAYRLIRPTTRFTRSWGRPARARAEAVRQVRELELEATSLVERTDNALKLIGDQYLSRVFGIASARFHLSGWQESIRRKLDTVGDISDLLSDQAGTRRMEALELIVILLIALEIVLALLRH
jgi:hypothetical protein